MYNGIILDLDIIQNTSLSTTKNNNTKQTHKRREQNNEQQTYQQQLNHIQKRMYI